jgi:3-oxoacyl-[acyl-carrier-protein] synthase III
MAERILMVDKAARITGVGFAVPDQVRTNDAPIFDWIRSHNPSHADLFKGFDRRHVLAPDETLASLMSAASAKALADARLKPQDIDLLIGIASVSDYVTPNGLVQLHQDLGLPARCQVLPIETEFTTFNDGLVLAEALIRTGRGLRNALIVCGCNWTRHVSYHEATCIGAADGAGAAVLAVTGDRERFALVDVVTETDTSFYGAMRMAARPVEGIDPPPPYLAQSFSTPLMYFGEEAAKAFEEFGAKVPPRIVERLLRRNGLTAGEITLISHQASSVLIDAWTAAIGPGQYLTTLTDYANMTSASVPVTLAARHAEIARDNLVLLTIGMQQQASAVLLGRRSA